MGGALYLLADTPFLVAGIAASIIYVLALALFRAVSLREIRSILFSRSAPISLD
jgi:hypothetical protein